jgi:hypothetical protein
VDRVKAALEEMRPTMLANVTAVFPLIAAMELKTKQTLDALGLPTIDYPSYLAYGRELWSMSRRDITGESAAQAAQVLLDKWVARGLVQPVLEAVRHQVFSISAPVVP